MKRRRFLHLLGLSSTLAFAMPALAIESKKKVLYYDYSSGYIHDVTRDKNGTLGVCGTFFKQFGEKNGLDVVCTKDGNVFKEDLSPYSAIILYTSGDLYQRNPSCLGNPVPAGTQEKLVETVRSGVGLLSLHATTDTWRCNGTSYEASPQDYVNDPDEIVTPFTKLVGGQFIKHGPHQTAEVNCTDPVELPFLKTVKAEQGGKVKLFEEWYCHKNLNPNLHVFVTLQTQGMNGDCYNRPPFPCAWAQQVGKGISAYSAFGHGPEQWSNPFVQGVTDDLLRLVTGMVSVDLTPNMKTACPNAGINHF